jgi:hypothetical protein
MPQDVARRLLVPLKLCSATRPELCVTKMEAVVVDLAAVFCGNPD